MSAFPIIAFVLVCITSGVSLYWKQGRVIIPGCSAISTVEQLNTTRPSLVISVAKERHVVLALLHMALSLLGVFSFYIVVWVAVMYTGIKTCFCNAIDTVILLVSFLYHYYLT